MRNSVLLKTLGVTALIVFTICSRRPETRLVVKHTTECEILPEAIQAPESITVALTEGINPDHAPVAHNPSEQLLFNHLYETLIRIDCRGEVYAGLASSWSSEEDGRLWKFELRKGACFWDGTPATAIDIVSCFQRSWNDKKIRAAGIDSTVAAGERTLQVHFHSPRRTVPRLFCAPEFAIAKQSTGSLWPVGTGPYRIDSRKRESHEVAEQAITIHPVSYRQAPVIHFLDAFMSDARDLIDGKIDMMVTRDPAVIDYAAGRSQFSAIALPWDLIYVLISTSRIQELNGGGKVRMLSSEILDRLARDAVRAEARGYTAPSWWDNLPACGELTAAYTGLQLDPKASHERTGLHRIIYDMNDPIAKDLTERIVALAAEDPTTSAEAGALASTVPGLVGNVPRTVAEGVTRDKLAESLRDGNDFAYIIPFVRRPADPCYEVHRLINRVEWLASIDGDLSDALVPLIETRRHVITSNHNVGLMFDWNISIFITNGLLQEK